MTGSKYSYLKTLICSQCGQTFDPYKVQTFCLACRAPLVAQYDLDLLKKELTRDEFGARSGGMWRWHELLPVASPEQIVSLGEGDTPLLELPRLAAHLGMDRVIGQGRKPQPDRLL